ncbi:hypothetical protein BD311DRAFT_752223 [Dichomitus squalens]|uniref:Uncharacterized protein n=1 Tax=Dichomitus squalens TaxID=114155 RepID=A0A4Q9MUP0_9APHY|nr:hypothetical protein BD311DRAFT_752223 [Dichomitus squalens]
MHCMNIRLELILSYTVVASSVFYILLKRGLLCAREHVPTELCTTHEYFPIYTLECWDNPGVLDRLHDNHSSASRRCYIGGILGHAFSCKAAAASPLGTAIAEEVRGVL